LKAAPDAKYLSYRHCLHFSDLLAPPTEEDHDGDLNNDDSGENKGTEKNANNLLLLVVAIAEKHLGEKWHRCHSGTLCMNSNFIRDSTREVQ